MKCMMYKIYNRNKSIQENCIECKIIYWKEYCYVIKFKI